ncbi:MAG: hypothetical protein N2378_16315 [Chloroflexaceae bacterium]|nr:hypothetical protein [Chloroflexaceae bacterium]
MADTPAMTIRVLRAAWSEDPLRARLRLGHAMQLADLRPPGLSPAAILCVRRLSDPLPGTLPVDGSAPPAAWQAALRDALARLAAAAARPFVGPAPPTAPAVLFADRAELLACLARDLADGCVAGRWWWRTLLGPAIEVSAEPWRATPHAVPAALALVGPMVAARCLATLPAREVFPLSAAVAAAYGLPAPGASATAPFPGPRPWPTGPTAAPAPAPRVRLAGATAAPAPVHQAMPSPWAARTTSLLRELAAEPAVQVLDPPRRALLALCFLLAREPTTARATAMADLAAWAAAPAPLAAGPGPVARPGPPPIRPERPAPRPAHDGRPAAPDGAAPAPQEAACGDTGAPEAQAPPRTVALASRPASPTREPGAPLAACATGLGGCFFLINLALALGLYGDFTRPLARGLALSPWDLLALLAPRLLRRDPRACASVADDPLWPLLAALAGRDPHAPPGAGFRPPARVRSSTLVPLPFRKRGGRARLARVESSGISVPLARWANRLAIRAQRRLARALGDPRLIGRVLAMPARVYVGPVRVDVVFGLADLPIEARLAGLDRDPGWVPAAGRDIRFHFE